MTTQSFRLLLCMGVLSTAVVAGSDWTALPKAAITQTRRLLNFSNLFGNASSQSHKYTPYDRVAGHPVFAVTTAWGSPYMNMEKVDLDSSENTLENESGRQQQPQSISEEQNEMRTVALYFMDPDDAMAVHGEMKQIDNMKSTDIRLTAMSLARALRQASCLSNGLPTGIPADPLTGDFNPSDGAALRYKIVPPKRQLYYAARCIGKERVGLFGDSPAEDAQTVIMGTSAIEAANLARRREKRERKTGRQRTPMQLQNAHMEGYTGIPVFHCPSMRKRHSFIKRLVTGQAQETPLFFNYEDLEVAWNRMRKGGKSGIPDSPTDVEVFNLWDVLTSMDKEAWSQKKKTVWYRPDIVKPLRRRFGKLDEPSLQDITFIPSSRSVEYKDGLSIRGNGKARLRPMR